MWSNGPPDERLATGGVGSIAVQPAVAAGSTVIGTARPGQEEEYIRSLGAAHAVDYTVDITAAVKPIAPTTQLTEKYGLSKASVLRLLHEAGAEMRRQPFSDQEVDDAVRLYASGLSVATVGSRLGAHPSKVWRALVARGVALRPSRTASKIT